MVDKTKRIVVACIIGTRPELIKMAPIIFKLKQSSWAEVLVVDTAQHRSLLDEMFGLFDLKPDFDLDCMTIGQSLGELTANLCSKMNDFLKNKPIDLLLAAGDTTTVLVSSLMAFYYNIPFGHIEAGLRTGKKREPFPEEINRVLTAPLATWHFAPTELEKKNLCAENIDPSTIIVTGNPVIDTLHWVIKNTSAKNNSIQYPNSIIVTAHRRENFGKPIENICEAIIDLSMQFQDVNFLFPVHPNPNVQDNIFCYLDKKPRIHLLPPLRYDEFAQLMSNCRLILTDSGGIQEEAPALHKPVIVLRNITERPAIITEGVGILVGTKKENIIEAVRTLLTDKKIYAQMSRGVSPYGDGHAAERIVDYIKQVFKY